MMNGDTEEKGIENSAISIDTKGLASRKVIQVKIDNPFLSNDDSDDDAEANNPFCIKVSKGQAEDHVTSELTNGNKSNSSVDEDKNADKSPLEAGKGPDVSEKEDILPDVISKNKEEGDSIENKSSKEGALEDDNSQCSSASRSSGKSDAGKSENNFGDVEDENSRESIKLSEKFDNEEAHELSQVVDSTVKSDNEVKSESETKDASDVIVKDSKNDMEKSCEGDVNMDSVDKTENTEEEKSTNNQYGGEKHSNKESSLKSDENLFSDVDNIAGKEEKKDIDIVENESKESKMDVDVFNSGQNCDVSGDAGDEKSKMDIGKEKLSEEDTNFDKTDVEKEKSYKRDIEEEGMEVDTKDDKVKEKVEENKTENAKDSDESEKVEDRNENESPKPELDKKSVDKVKDDDGTDILITVNEDNSDDESKEESEEAKNKTDSTSDIKDKDVSKTENKTRPETPKIKSVFENDVVIVDLSAESPKDDKAKPAWSTSQTPVNTTIKSMLKPIAPVPSTNQLPVTSTAGVNGAIVINGQQYVQQIMYDVNGRKQIVQVPISNANKHLYSSMLSQAALAVKTPSLQGIATAAKAAPPKPKTGLARFKDVDDNIPIASWEQLDLIKYEWSTKKYDNTFWAGQCPVNKTAELSAPTRFLMDLGSDLVKKSAYDQITKIQGMKEKAGKLGKNEQQNLDRMSSIVKELKEKLKHLDVTTHKCDGCNFVTESTNVMQFHKEHPHMVPPMDPFGDLGCSFADCDFKAVKPTEFAAHMENVHKMKARVYDKPEAHRCSLCYYEAKMKNQLTKHKFKCIKQFKPNMNQSPHYTDISYCLKNIFYKYQIKRLAPPPKPATIVKATAPRNYSPLRPTILQNNKVPVSMPFAGNQPIVVNSGNLQYRPVLALNNITNQPVQLINMPVSQAVTNSVSQPTVNELLKAKTAPKVNSNTAYSNVAPPAQKSAFEVCEICGGYVKDKMSLRIHFFYAHKVDLAPHLFNRGLPPLSCEVCRKTFWTSQGLGKHKHSLKHYGQSNLGKTYTEKTVPKCWICFQTPENLYSHIHKFHRLSTSECMALRRCMFCGIQSNTRRDLEIHMAASHGVLIKGEQNAKIASKPPTSGLVRNNFCVFCSLHFSDNTQLTLHCLRDHATCSACGMVVANSAHLKTHICKNAPSKKCEICGIKNLKPQYYIKHVTSHLKKCSIKIRRLTEKQIEEAMGKERKAEMDLQKQKELFTKLEADIWNEIESRRKRDREEDKVSKDPVLRKRRMENEKEEKVKKKIQKLEDTDRDYKPNDDDDVVVVDD